MKIAFLTSGTIKSSISYRPLAFAKELVKAGHDVSIFAPRFDKYSKFQDEGITQIDGVKIIRPLQIRLFSFELGLISYMISMLLILHRLKPDIVDIYKATPITIVGLLLKFTLKTKIVFATDDIDSEVMKIEKYSSLKIKLVETSEKIITRYADAIIAGSQYLQKKYSKQYKNKIIDHIPNGAEFSKTEKLSIEKISTNRVIFIGNINRVNILEPLFTVIKKLKDQKMKITTVIIGSGKYLNYFMRLSKKLKLNCDLHFLGRIPQNKLYKYVKVGDIGYSYMPNEVTQKACSNMKVFQYMQFGAVPIVSNVGDLPLYVFYEKAGYIARYGDIDSLTQIFKNALLDKKSRREKVEFGIKHAKARYSWQILANKLEVVYKKLL